MQAQNCIASRHACARRLTTLTLLAAAACPATSPPARNPATLEKEALDTATEVIMQSPDRWEAALGIALGSLPTSPHSFIRDKLEQLRLEVDIIRRERPDCRAAANAFLLDSLTYLQATLNNTSSAVPPLEICPSDALEAPRGQASVSLRGFTTFLRADSRTILVGRNGVNEALLYASAPTHIKVTFDASEDSCLSGTMTLGTSTVTLRPSVTPDPECIANAEHTRDLRHAGCTEARACCNFDNVSHCILARCKRECDERTAAAPWNRPAISDACSEQGAFYQWCRRECGEGPLATCNRGECSSDTSDTACRARADILFESERQACPLKEVCP